jgi:hypothetical protein
MYYLLIERVSIVTIEFLQYQARVRIGLNRTGIERVVERTGLFTSLPLTTNYVSVPRLNYQKMSMPHLMTKISFIKLFIN